MTERLDLKRLFFSISSLLDLGQEVTSSKDVNEKMKRALYVVTGMFSVPKAALFVSNSNGQHLTLLTSKGISDAHGMELTINQREIKKLQKNEAHAVSAMKKTVLYKNNQTAFKTMETKFFIPLFAKDEFVGALALGKKLGSTSYLQSEIPVLKVIANQIAIALHNSNLFQKLTKKSRENKKLYENMRLIYHDTIQAFAAAIDAKDVYTRNHSYRVARYAVAIAMELNWKQKDIEGIYISGLLHDIGKIIIDKKLINKGEKLSDAEMSEIRRHPQISHDILSKIKFPWKDVAFFVKHHHERVDGTGYPGALQKTQMSDGMKILALADAFDAMTTDRPYRDRLTLSEALNEIKACLGTQFDEEISKVFFKVLQREVKGEVREKQIVPHLDKDFDPRIIIALLEGIIAELS